MSQAESTACAKMPMWEGAQSLDPAGPAPVGLWLGVLIFLAYEGKPLRSHPQSQEIPDQTSHLGGNPAQAHGIKGAARLSLHPVGS